MAWAAVEGPPPLSEYTPTPVWEAREAGLPDDSRAVGGLPTSSPFLPSFLLMVPKSLGV